MPDQASSDAHVGFDIPPGDGALPGDIVSLRVMPPTVTLHVVDGQPLPMQAFTVVGVRRDGMQTPLPGVWTVTTNAIVGAIANDGTFTASGIAAGTATVDAAAPGTGGATLHGTATITVQINHSVLGPGTTMAAATTFEAAPTSSMGGTASLVYPLDGAMMPHNVAAPDIQWDNGAAGDIYRIRITKPDLSLQAYLLHSGPGFAFDLRPDAPTWRSAVESDVDANLTIVIDRYSVATHTVALGTPISVRIGRDSIFGNVYYWATNEGRLKRIDATTSALDPTFLQTPPNGCVACHSLSRDGRYLIGATQSGSTYQYIAYDLTVDLSGASPPALPPITNARMAGTFGPDPSRALLFGLGDTGPTNGFLLINPITGASVPSTGLPMNPRVAWAEWSPDGANVVFATNLMGNTAGYTDHYTSSDLVLMGVTGDLDHLTFAAPTMLHHGPDVMSMAEGGGADAHPTFSPDSRVIAFQHSVEASSQFSGMGALYLLPTTGGASVRLNNAMGGASATSGFWPGFSPFVSHEIDASAPQSYYWLAFHSERDYGNTLAGTRGTSNRQLWVTAVRANAPAGSDPSSVAYWLPGQDRHSQNAAARWAPVACRNNGSACTTGAACCSSMCNASGHCDAPPPTQCRQAGQLCGGDADCCNGLTCFGNVCGAAPG